MESQSGPRKAQYQLTNFRCEDEGGSALVFSARANPAPRAGQYTVAVKMINPRLSSGEPRAQGEYESACDRFLRAEMPCQAALDHEFVVQVYEYVNEPSRHLVYAVLEWVHGQALDRAIDKWIAGKKIPNVERRLSLFRNLLIAVSHAHGRLICHRDLKPPNVLITGDPENPIPKLSDFGIARNLRQSDAQWRLTTVGMRIEGSGPYVAPELRADLQAGDTASDTYSLGVMLLELLLLEALPANGREREAFLGQVVDLVRKKGAAEELRSVANYAVVDRYASVIDQSLRPSNQVQFLTAAALLQAFDKSDRQEPIRRAENEATRSTEPIAPSKSPHSETKLAKNSASATGSEALSWRAWAELLADGLVQSRDSNSEDLRSLVVAAAGGADLASWIYRSTKGAEKRPPSPKEALSKFNREALEVVKVVAYQLSDAGEAEYARLAAAGLTGGWQPNETKFWCFPAHSIARQWVGAFNGVRKDSAADADRLVRLSNRLAEAFSLDFTPPDRPR